VTPVASADAGEAVPPALPDIVSLVSMVAGSVLFRVVATS
jgi:hypothetical protein